MPQLCDPKFRRAIADTVTALQGRCALAGNVGAQLHLAAALGLDKLGPPARVIEVVSFGPKVPSPIGDATVVALDAMGFEASVEMRRRTIEIEGESFPVAAAEHILGMRLASADLGPDAKWACFLLMQTLHGKLDLEEVRAFLKRCESVERQQLLAELAYLAA